MASAGHKYSLLKQTRQSAPLEFPGSASDAWLAGKTVLITGGASGFGEGFVRRWAAAGACIVLGDVNVPRGTALAEEVRKSTGNPNVHFQHCDVTSWPSQVSFFKAAVKLSPHGGIDTVVANAGIVDIKNEVENPKDLDAENPPPPNIDCLNVNLNGVVYTAHLALFYLQKNPGSKPADPNCDPETLVRDRHLLLLGSVAGFLPIPSQCLYGASKHAVMGLYRCLRSSVFVHGIRINMLCPYFIDTPLLTTGGRVVLAGGTIGKPEDVVEAATRFAADPRIVGRAVFVGPKLKVEVNDETGDFKLTEREDVQPKAIWELYPMDFDDSDLFQRNVVGMLNRAVEIRGWIGWASDILTLVGIRARKTLGL
ncbi:hypothetical protein MMC30_005860 [Trapelia coarctata]|nr:hypothetical protein [Trapelia coarctata]